VEKKVVGKNITAIRLLNFQNYLGDVYIIVQDLKTSRRYYLSWNMKIDGDCWPSSQSDLETLTNIPMKDE
jgi:hypothetical protein